MIYYNEYLISDVRSVIKIKYYSIGKFVKINDTDYYSQCTAVGNQYYR